MPILIILGLLILYLTFYGMEIWVRTIFQRHAAERADLPGSGAEFATYLLKQDDLTGVSVEMIKRDADHYDANKQAIRLREPHFNGKSLTAMVVAAHEEAHCYQYFHDLSLFRKRKLWLRNAEYYEAIAAGLIMAAPALFFFVHSLHVLLLMLLLALLMISAQVIVHLMTLNIERDAVYSIAKPRLEQNNHFSAPDQKAIDELLKVSSYRMLAKSLSRILDPTYWFAVLYREAKRFKS